MEERMEDKCVVITGASSGAGRAMAVALAQRGCSLVLAARRQEALKEVMEECATLGASVIYVVTDVKEAIEQRRLAEEAVRTFGRVDVWVNNAGVLAAGAFDDVPEEVNEDVIRTNLLGYVHGAHAILPYFKQQGYGIIINNISVGGWFPTPYMSAYSASKFGLRGFSESLKGELTPFPNIHICDLYPAFLDTPGIQHAANFTGRLLRPAPPVYDPQKVANAVVRLIHHPRPKQAIGAAATFLRLAHALFPTLSRNITATVIRKYLNNAVPIETTSGNVLTTVDYGTAADGNWRGSGLSREKKSLLLASVFLAGLVLVTSKK
jgi:short-subunit dehydrogenase